MSTKKSLYMSSSDQTSNEPKISLWGERQTLVKEGGGGTASPKRPKWCPCIEHIIQYVKEYTSQGRWHPGIPLVALSFHIFSKNIFFYLKIF